MLLSLKKKDSDQIETENLSAQLSESNQRKEYFLISILALLQFVKEFALDLKEINSDGFKKDIIRLSDKFATEKKIKRIQSHFEKGQKGIDAFINLQKKYLIDRDDNF